mmetsp:Transcript_106312/g.189043  ORF Transcript_106312/g.189043 Transcript_106312/m.189043 type:complete len:333 (-) Transcript_106312:66-1064(-)|eukprot:CAMPEP_0197626354 /NCGR_PEP_ID=MMETSP1338-20131121/5364_1 /TAXON_ID=43686 ORGANISM="Pelagodinium beii, Strain RCC1491" /NCGR_SAMPLE_ID=MMETSP1338 /ASSEMBLY_ACC=CAM_ASM_000754 /LENGTH=332 /DNA_ID=CAMNT_0043196893 /DNA_START=72 /DNA_END=1070 /DNA_ORIENTATION=+
MLKGFGVILLLLPAHGSLPDDSACSESMSSFLQLDLAVKALQGPILDDLLLTSTRFNRSSPSWLETSSKRSAQQSHRLHGFVSYELFAIVQASLALGFVTLMLVTLCFLCGHSYVTGETLRRGFSRYGYEKLLGVNAKVGTVEVNLISGHIFVGDVMLANPPGYSMPYLLKAKNIFIDINVYDLLTSGGQLDDVEVDMVRIYGLEVFCETKGLCGAMTSNTSEVYNMLFKNDAEKVSTNVLKSSQDKLPNNEGLLLHELFLDKFKIQYKSNFLSKKAGMANLHMELQSIKYDDFGKQYGPRQQEEVLRIVLGRILTAVMRHVATQAVKEAFC